MQHYDKHTSSVKSPGNYVNFLLESPLNSLDLDFGKCVNLEIHFWLKSGKVRELKSHRARESQGTLLKKLRGNLEGVLHSFAELKVVKPCFLRVN